MSNLSFKDQLHDYTQWRERLYQSIEMYQEWRTRYRLSDPHSTNTVLSILEGLKSNKITLAFVAEFSRGKTELINALFFAETGVRLLPSAAGRTTMCPTELFYDPKGSYIRLLNIETRLEDTSLMEYKTKPNQPGSFCQTALSISPSLSFLLTRRSLRILKWELRSAGSLA